MSINLFIDSNIWLSLYHFTSDDLSQFGKLKDLIGKSVKLFVPQQVYDEVLRNRETKLKDAFVTFDIKKIQYPAFCKEYDEFAQFNQDYQNIIQRFRLWKRKIDEDVKNRCLPADQTIKEFFHITGLISCDNYVDRAYTRYKIGNPPGKENKFGDAINWECLLDNIPNGEDLFFISADKDYRSEIIDGAFNAYLLDEWKRKKGADIHYYRDLVSFLNKHFEDIQLISEQEKQKLIMRLQNSGSFLSTHGTIAMLSKYAGWTDSQIEDLCKAAEDNNQVGWILGDDDVYDFYNSFLSQIPYGDLPDNAIKRVMDQFFSVTDDKKRESARD